MTWVKLDDQFPDHPKVVRAGPLASWLYVCGLTYCARQLTDGFIPHPIVRRLADVDEPYVLADVLVSVGLWHEVQDGYAVHDYDFFAFGAPESWMVPTRRAWNAMRKRVAPQVFERDGRSCASCGATKQLEIDHVIPITHGGTNGLDNLQVLCRSCNATKGAS